jgi:hypothetical protein
MRPSWISLLDFPPIMSSGASSFARCGSHTLSVGGSAAESSAKISIGIVHPALPKPPYPPALSEEAIACIPLQLPPIPLGVDGRHLSPALISAAESLRIKFAYASSNARSVMRSMRQSWMMWPILYNASEGLLNLFFIPFFCSFASRSSFSHFRLQSQMMILSSLQTPMQPVSNLCPMYFNSHRLGPQPRLTRQPIMPNALHSAVNAATTHT